MKLIRWLDKNFELSILAVLLAVMSVLSFVNVIMICSVIMLVFLGFLLAGTCKIAATSAGIGQASPALRIPVAWLYGTMGFAVAFAMFRYVQFIVRTLMKKGDEQ